MKVKMTVESIDLAYTINHDAGLDKAIKKGSEKILKYLMSGNSKRRSSAEKKLKFVGL